MAEKAETCFKKLPLLCGKLHEKNTAFPGKWHPMKGYADAGQMEERDACHPDNMLPDDKIRQDMF